MVRFFDKLKGSLGKKQPSTPPEDPPSTAPDPGTALATSSPAVVEDASSAHRSSETASKSESSPVVLTQTASVKRSRVRVRRVMRPRPVIRERYTSPHEEPKDSEDSDGREESVSSPEPVADIEAPEKPASSPRHVITRKPKAQKRLRKVRVVKPKVRVVR